MKWQFSVYPIDMVEMEVTQRDQFRNDEVDLADTLIRETVQNSLDARYDNGTPVRVRFGFLAGPNGPDPDFIRQIFDGQLEHAHASGLSVDTIDFDHPTAIVVEDFNTKGLQGNPTQRGDDDFSDFWRRHGISHKAGGSRGRWGLGKLVFSSSSLLHAFFGLTIPADTRTRLLMGQTVLQVHSLGGNKYQAHTHFSEVCESGPDAGLRVPITDPVLIDMFTSQFGLKRRDEPGLSLAIPFQHPDLERGKMIAAAIRHYFIPILRGQLVIEFDDLVLDATSISDCAHRYLPPGTIHDVEELFDFVRLADAYKKDAMITLDGAWYKDKGDQLEQALPTGALETLRNAFRDGEVIAIRFPIDFTRKDGNRVVTEFSGFLRKPASLTKGQDYYVRSGITVPAESKFGQRKALGLLLADDTPISEFLGDAENPAHTQWISKAEKALKNYKGTEARVAAIKKCLVILHDLLAQAVEEKAEEALLDFFWHPGMGVGPRKGAGEDVFRPRPPAPPEPQPFRVSPQAGGFTVRRDTGLTAEKLPMEATISVAYDVDEGNPYKLYSPYDFDFSKPGDARIEVRGVEIAGATGNIIRCVVRELDFLISVSGLDEKRDLIIRMEDA